MFICVLAELIALPFLLLTGIACYNYKYSYGRSFPSERCPRKHECVNTIDGAFSVCEIQMLDKSSVEHSPQELPPELMFGHVFSMESVYMDPVIRLVGYSLGV